MAAFIFFGIIAALSVLALVSSRWGVDSRDGFSDAYRSVGPIGLH
jgi:hypothetical protein